MFPVFLPKMSFSGQSAAARSLWEINPRKLAAKKEVQEKLRTEEKRENAIKSQRKFDARPTAR